MSPSRSRSAKKVLMICSISSLTAVVVVFSLHVVPCSKLYVRHRSKYHLLLFFLWSMRDMD